MRLFALSLVCLCSSACDQPSIDSGLGVDRRSLILWSTEPTPKEPAGSKGGNIKGLAIASPSEEEFELGLGSAVAACSLMFSVDRYSSPGTTYYAINYKGLDLRGELELAAKESFECVRRNIAGHFSAGIGDFHTLEIDTSVFDDYAENSSD